MRARASLRALRWARVLFQGTSLALAFWVFLRSLDPFEPALNPFLRLDPLVWPTWREAALAVLLPIAALLGLAALLGRAFCGWLCPLGALITLQDRLLSPLRVRNPWRLRPRPDGRLLARYPPALLLLGAALLSAFFHPSLLPWLHPAVWIVRMFARSALGLIFWGGLLAGALFSTRLWCIHLCPLGALYGLLARFAPLRLEVRRCSGCGRCDRCPMEAVPASSAGRRVRRELCSLCLAIEELCPVKGFHFGSRPPRGAGFPADPSRRLFLRQSTLFAGGLALGGALSRLGPAGRTPLLRPPGVSDEARFLQRCLRCHQCVRSCPNRIIRSAALEGGLESLFTPHLAFEGHGCDYYCQACQLVCPNEAIPRQTLARKQASPIGLAHIDPTACVVTARGLPCLVCEEFCPIPEKAIRFELRVVEAGGKRLTLQVPLVVPARCNGCGICQAHCPSDPLAIRVKKG